jgi:hypothetical protein
MENRRAREKINELHIRIRSHMREHNSIVSKEGWPSGRFKRKIMSNLRQEIFKISCNYGDE